MIFEFCYIPGEVNMPAPPIQRNRSNSDPNIQFDADGSERPSKVQDVLQPRTIKRKITSHLETTTTFQSMETPALLGSPLPSGKNGVANPWDELENESTKSQNEILKCKKYAKTIHFLY